MIEKDAGMSLTDEELVVNARGGASAALNELWRRYQRRIFLFVRRKVGTDQDAEDITQETFIRAMRYLDRFDERFRFSTWLYTMCHQLIVSHYRRRKVDDLPDDLPMQGDGPADVAEVDSLKERLWLAATVLPQKQFDVIWLRYVEDMSVSELAKSLSISGINARVLLHRARQTLMRTVTENSGLAPGINVCKEVTS